MEERIINISNRLIQNAPRVFERYITQEVNWDNQLIGISGARGSGKTIILLQQALKEMMKNKNVLYTSLDDIYFSENNLLNFAIDFDQEGGEILFLDEVHKYKNWSQELKNIYDSVPSLKIVFTSSSALEIHKGSHDLSRRAIIYNLQGLSFREYLELKHDVSIPKYSLEEILDKHIQISTQINQKIRVITHFKSYLESGYYPFFLETGSLYLNQLNATINTVIEVDLPAIFQIDFNSIIKIKKLLSIISNIVPFKPNVEKLAKQLNTTRPTLLKYLYYLDKAKVIQLLGADAHGINYLNKPEKIYLGNPNIAYGLANSKPDIGNLRETFFLNQVSHKHHPSYTKSGDFLVDNHYTFEVGGKNKSKKQISEISNAYIIADNLEYGNGNKIPLWLFGFMY